jgi:2-keto-3-deoxy-L-rhamnonate aldolase RhmA
MNVDTRAVLREKRLHLGTWLCIGSPVVAELAAESGFDWLLFDMEHGSYSEAALLPQFLATRGSGVAAVVRVGSPHPDLVGHVLDWGADGLMFPHVNSAAEAEACVQTAHYPPRGRRGLNRSVRAHGYGLRPPVDGQTSPAPLVIVQIESIEGVENVDEIARVDGVDVLFVGPSDLRFDLAARPALAKRGYAECVARVAAAVAASGKPGGFFTRDLGDVRALQSQGFEWIGFETDLTILRNAYRTLVEAVGKEDL